MKIEKQADENIRPLGRPHKWGEPAKTITVPIRAIDAVNDFIRKWVQENKR